MTHIEVPWQTPDGLPIFGQVWEPDAKLRAIVCLVHGLGEHSSRYAHLAKALTGAGFALFTMDLRGHGRSGGRRGHTPSYGALMDDVSSLLAQATRLAPAVPLFLYGHSMGGNLVLNYVLRCRPAIAGAIVTGPWLRLAFAPPRWRLVLARSLDRLWPSFTQASGLAVQDLSRDPTVVQAYAEDPLVHDRVSVRLFTSLDAAGRWALEHAGQFPVPLLLMHGGADRITSAAASRTFASNAGSDVTFRLWENGAHEVHNEPMQQAVIQAMLDWLNRQTAPPRLSAPTDANSTATARAWRLEEATTAPDRDRR